VDTHGQSIIAFAFCYLLGFELMPRFKGIGRQKLIRPDKKWVGDYSNLDPIFAQSPINWVLIMQQYDEMAALSLLPHSHFNPYGNYNLDMSERLPLEAMKVAA
jgi:TnpA family transposase